jgi:hypothetical protein
MLVAAGFSVMRAARFVGCAPSTVHRHRRHDEPFAMALREATRAASARAKSVFRKPGPGNWRASAWFLDRLKHGREAPLTPHESALRLMWILKGFLCQLVRLEAGEELFARISCRIDDEFRKLESIVAARAGK